MLQKNECLWQQHSGFWSTNLLLFFPIYSASFLRVYVATLLHMELMPIWPQIELVDLARGLINLMHCCPFRARKLMSKAGVKLLYQGSQEARRSFSSITVIFGKIIQLPILDILTSQPDWALAASKTSCLCVCVRLLGTLKCKTYLSIKILF